MSYPLQTKKKNNKFKKGSLFLFVLLILVGILFFRPFSVSVRYLASKLSSLFPISSLSSWLHTKSYLIEENQRLKESLLEANSKLFDRDIILEENLKYKKLDESNKEDSIVSPVLLRPGFSPYDTIVLGKGSLDGVNLGASVYFNSLAIGEISEVGDKMSKATLFSSSGKTFPVNINNNKLETEAKGLGGGSFEIMIPKNIKVEIGEVVTFANHPNRVIGIVEDVGEKNDNDTFQRILFSLPININSLDFVFIDKE